MSARNANRAFSKENEAFVKQGWYPSPTTHAAVDLCSLVEKAKRTVMSYDVPAIDRVLASVTSSPSPNLPTTLSVTAESSSASAERLHALGAPGICVLNFASARNPGGGYINGATAQEEDICRSSALYTTLLEAPDMYKAHKNMDGRYTHRMIYSPSVPMYRSSAGALLPAPYTIDFITSPAPNLGALQSNHPHLASEVPQILVERAARILALCAHHGARTLVLGAWGCGVFRNSPAEVAKVFHDLLKPGGTFHGRFDAVVFAIYDRSHSQEVMSAFAAEFGPAAAPGIPTTVRPRPPGSGRTRDPAQSREKRASPTRTPAGDGGSDQRRSPQKIDGQARITAFFQPQPRG